MSTQSTSVPKRLIPFLNQFDFGIEQLLERLDGLTDEEYLWEPVPGCWSIRPRGQSHANASLGKGDWVLERESPEPVPAPFTTLAWRLCHLASGLSSRADYTNGTHSLSMQQVEIPTTAGDAIATLTSAAAAWRSALESAGDAELDQVGYSQLPWGLDPQLPFIEIVWWVNKEVLHHAAEMALLRDLYLLRAEAFEYTNESERES